MSEAVFLGLGSNTGNRELNLRNAIGRISADVGEILTYSHIYETESWGFESKDRFLNMVLKIKTQLAPEELLGRLLGIEAELGRVREKERYSSRTIDIDILLYGNRIISTSNLVIPHPLIQKRRFVLVPLVELIPDGIHPTLGETFLSLLYECKDKGEVKLYR